MENSRTLKSRALALLLTVLMVVGVLPMTIFAVGAGVQSQSQTGTALDEGVKFVAPSLEAIKDKFGASSILYYNNFTNAAEGVAKFTPTSTSQIVNGEYIAVSSGEKAHTAFWPMGENWNFGGHSNYSGKSFVIAMDVKMPAGGLTRAGSLWTANSRDVNGGAFFSPVLFDSNGELYLGHNGTNTIETHEGSFSAASLSGANKVGGVIGHLSEDEFTNVAVVFQPADNVYRVYINGVDVSGDIRMFSDAKLTAIAETNYKDGWIPRQIFMNYVNANGSTSTLVFDNLTAYLGDDYIVPAFELPAVQEIQKVADKWNLIAYYPFDGSKNEGSVISGEAELSFATGNAAFVDGAAAQGHLDSQMNFSLFVNGDNNNAANVADAGKSFVYSLDIKLGAESFKEDIKISLCSGDVAIDDVIGINQKGYLTSKGAKIAKLSTSEFINVAVLVNVENNTFNVYVNGVRVVYGAEFLTDDNKTAIASSGLSAFALSKISFDANGLTNDGTVLYYDNVTAYWGNRYILKGDGDKGVYNASFSFDYTPADYYNSNADYWQEMTYTGTNLDGNGLDRETTIYPAGVSSYDDVAGLENVWKSNLAGLDFVVDMNLFVDATNNGSVPIKVMNHYNGAVTVLEIKTADNKAELWFNNPDTGVSKKLCSLPTNDYTRVQLIFDVGGDDKASAGNYVHVYVDGKFVYNAKLFSEATLEGIYAFFTDRAALDEGYARGFMPSGFQIAPTGTTVEFESFGIYYYDDDADKELADGERGKDVIINVSYEYNVAEGKVYYMEDGEIKGDRQSPDGILDIDGNGIVYFNGTAIESMTRYYTIIDEEIVPVEDVFSGLYVGNTLGGKLGHVFYYDVNSKRVADKTAYDVSEDNGAIGTNVTGYSFDSNGKGTALNGLYEVDISRNRYYYVNGVKTTGFAEAADGLYFLNPDYTFFDGYIDIDGKTYYFDARDGYRGYLVNSLHTDNGSEYRYYKDGILQTGLILARDTKYFADANGKLLVGVQMDPISGNEYFFHPETAGDKKFTMAAGESVVWQGTILTIGSNGVITEKSKVYGKWTQIGDDVYYSNASGEVVKGLTYIDTDITGNAGGYYYFDNNGVMISESYVTVYGTEMYFGADGKAANGVTVIGGDYYYFVDGVKPDGYTYAIVDGVKYTFEDGECVAVEDVEESVNGVVVTIIKGLNRDTFYFSANADKKFNLPLAKYPCYAITVYNLANGEEVAANEDGSYTLVAQRSYEVVYTQTEHTFNEVAVETVAPTCGANGYNVYKCMVDGCVATKKVIVEKTNAHEFDNANVIPLIAPECNKDGVGKVYCTNGCGMVHTVDIPATGEHNWVIEKTEAATCEKQGLIVYKCGYSCCNEYKHEVLDFVDHEWDEANATVVVAPNCVEKGKKKVECKHCDAVKYLELPIDTTAHKHPLTVKADTDANLGYYEFFQTVKVPTCLETGIDTYRCKDCGGFVYGVVTSLDPNNHHYNANEEYLAVLDSDGRVIEIVGVIDYGYYALIYINDENNTVGELTSWGGTRREQLLSYSRMICGYRGEWRINCKSGCQLPAESVPADAIPYEKVYHKLVDVVDGNFSHSIDLSKRYTTNDPTNPLYGTHYYVCRKCNSPAAIEAHTMKYVDNGDGTHNYVCEDGCRIEGTNAAYGEFNIACEFAVKYDAYKHREECVCGAKRNEADHTMTPGYDAKDHWTECACGYIVKEAHNFVDVPKKDATCCESGYEAYGLCSCGATDGYEVIEILAHNIDYSTLVSDATGHWYGCTNECGANGEKCTFKVYEQAHSFIDVDELAATCTSDGYSAHKVCGVCNYKEGYTVYPTVEHNVNGQPYNFDDVKHWQICVDCGATVENNHNLGTVIDDEEGSKQCTDCLHIVNDSSLTWWAELGLERVTVGDAYRYTYGTTKDAIVTIKNNLYYFDADGYLVMAGDSGVNNANVPAANGKFDTVYGVANRGILGRAVLDTVNGIYYVDGGEIMTGWIEIDGKDYFFNAKLGNELVADAPEGMLIKPAAGEGTIIALNYTNDAKILVNTDEEGARLLGVVMVGNKAYYYIDGTAGCLKGRIADNYLNVGNIYFANANGELYSGEWQNVNGVYYSFNADYSMKEWHSNATTELGGETIYTDGEGKKIVNGWFDHPGVGGYYIENGVMLKNVDYKKLDVYYSFDANGVATKYTGWVRIDNSHSHYVSDGNEVKNAFHVIGGDNHYFDAIGHIIKAEAGETLMVYIASFVYAIDENGVATKYDTTVEAATWVYFVVDGELTAEKGYCTHTGLIKDQAFDINDATYVFDENGRVVTSKDNYDCNGVIYVIDAEGKATVKDEEDGE